MPSITGLFHTIQIYTKGAKLSQSRQGGEDVLSIYLDGLLIKYESIPSTRRVA